MPCIHLFLYEVVLHLLRWQKNVRPQSSQSFMNIMATLLSLPWYAWMLPEFLKLKGNELMTFEGINLKCPPPFFWDPSHVQNKVQVQFVKNKFLINLFLKNDNLNLLNLLDISAFV